MIGIYKIINKINHKFYIGQSNNIERRWMEHCSPTRYKTSNMPLEWAIHKYGKENFFLEVLQECSIQGLNALETFWIEKTNAVENGYNCNCGGDCGTRGEQNPNAKLSKEDIIFIRKCYGEKLITQKQAYKVVENKISFSTFQSIWQGKSWSSIMPEVYTKENKEYYRKEASIKIVGKISEEQVIELRRKYSNGATARELYENYKNILTYNAFQCILCGRAYKHLPYFHKKTNRWIMPGEEPEKNKSRVQKNKNRRTTGVYTDEEVLSFRK